MSDPHTPARDDADAKAWFYLDHRDDIETWAALRSDARQLLDKHLVGVADEMAELADQFGVELDTGDLESGSKPRAGPRRQSWHYNGIADVSVVVQWERARLLTPGSNEWPWVAVRVPAAAADDGRGKQIIEGMKPVRSLLKGQSSAAYPLWRYVRPPAGAAVNPGAFVDDVLTSFRELWDAAAPILDAIHGDPAGLRLGPATVPPGVNL